MNRAKDGREGHAPRPLDVVVEAGDLWAPLVQHRRAVFFSLGRLVSPADNSASARHSLTVAQPKVLEMEVRLGIQPACGRDKGRDELVVLLAADPLLPETQVQRVVEEGLVVGSAVQHHGQHAVRVDAGADGGEDQLGDGYEDAAASLVADAEDFFAVCVLSGQRA